MIEINEDNLIEQLKNISENSNVDELDLFFDIDCDIEDIENLKLIENFDFSKFQNLKRLKVGIPNFLDDVSNFMLALSKFLSNIPYGLEKVEINFDFIDIQEDFYEDFDNNMILFISKIYDTVTYFKFYINYSGFFLNKSLKNFKNLIYLELKFQCIGDLIGKRLRQMITNNKELTTLSITLIEINNDVPVFKKIDTNDWFLNLSFCIYNHKNLNNLNIIWKFSIHEIKEDLIEPFKDIIKKFQIKKSLKYINKNKQILNKNILLKYTSIEKNNSKDKYLKKICQKYLDSNQALDNSNF